jgi:xylose isomerase
MDTFAHGLLIAQRLIEDKVLTGFLTERYKSYSLGIGAKIMAGETGFEDLEKWVLAEGGAVLPSGRQEMLENIVNSYIAE